MFIRLDSGEHWVIAWSSGVQLPPRLKRFRAGFERAEVEAFACMDDISLGLMQVTTSTASAILFLRRELDGTGLVVNAANTVEL